VSEYIDDFDACVARVYKYRHCSARAPAFVTIHEQPFPFPRCCRCGFSGPDEWSGTTRDPSARQYNPTQRPNTWLGSFQFIG